MSVATHTKGVRLSFLCCVTIVSGEIELYGLLLMYCSHCGNFVRCFQPDTICFITFILKVYNFHPIVIVNEWFTTYMYMPVDIHEEYTRWGQYQVHFWQGEGQAEGQAERSVKASLWDCCHAYWCMTTTAYNPQNVHNVHVHSALLWKMTAFFLHSIIWLLEIICNQFQSCETILGIQKLKLGIS